MSAQQNTGVRTDFVINDQVGGYLTRSVRTPLSAGELARFVRDGYLPYPGILGANEAAAFGAAVLRLARAEEARPGAEYLPGRSIYLRALLDKDPLFHRLLRFPPALSMARTLLGPQVWVDLEARMNYPGQAGVAVPWHGHLPVIPDPLPPLFSYPHQVHCLIYLDRITEAEGALCLIPGSHNTADLRIPLGDDSDRPGQVGLYFEPGDAVLIHANLWHRTAASTSAAGFRRLLLLGYVPSWIRRDTGAGVPAERPLADGFRTSEDAEMRELAGEFQW